jgi:voltage-gated potassium channel
MSAHPRRRARSGAVTGRQAAFAFAAFAMTVTLGTIGFVVLGESPLDALYRTLNTVTTAGMDDPPHRSGEQLLTLVLVVAGVANFLYIIGLVIELVVGGFATGIWERRRMDAQIDRLSGHHIVCGYGRVGSRVARDLEQAGETFVVVDGNPDAAERARADGRLLVPGEMADDAVLLKAGLERAASLVACADDDAANVYVVLGAREMRPDLLIVARASRSGAAQKLERAGANRVVSPYETAGEQIASLLTRPHVTAYLTMVAAGDRPDLSIEEIVVPDDFAAAGRTIRDLAVGAETGALVLAVRKPGQPLQGRPSPDVTIDPGDVVIGLGTPDTIARLEALLASGAGRAGRAGPRG